MHERVFEISYFSGRQANEEKTVKRYLVLIVGDHHYNNDYENVPSAINRDFFQQKNEKFHLKKLILLIMLFKTWIVDTRYNEYPHSTFWIKNKKNRYTPANPSFTMYKWV